MTVSRVLCQLSHFLLCSHLFASLSTRTYVHSQTDRLQQHSLLLFLAVINSRRMLCFTSLTDGQWSRDLTAQARSVGCNGAGQLAALQGMHVCEFIALITLCCSSTCLYLFGNVCICTFMRLCVCALQRSWPLGT